MSNTSHIKNQMQDLKLSGMLLSLESSLAEATQEGLSHTDLLAQLLQAESDWRQERLITSRIKGAKLKEKPTLEDFDFTAKRSITKTQIKELFNLGWLKAGRPMLIIGPTGVGKTFLSQALGHHACHHKYTVLFMTFSDYLEHQILSRSSNTYLKFRQKLTKPDLLILDDFGLRKLMPQESHDFNDLLKERGGIKSLIITTQLPVDHWSEVIEDPVIADTIIDQLIHTSLKLILEGESYRKVTGKKLDAQPFPD